MRGLSGTLPDTDEQLVVYCDEQLLVLDKPSGLLCVPGRGPGKEDCLSARAQRLYPDALVVHRLDMSTSGLCVMARGAAIQRSLSLAFAQREVSKRYLAVVAGRLTPPVEATDGWALIDLPIAADWPRRPLRIIDLERGKPSQTRWRALRGPSPGTAAGRERTRLELEPITGRTHQLRVHLAALGHPILGDPLYAPPEVQADASRLLLHASELRFEHPVSGQALVFQSPAPF